MPVPGPRAQRAPLPGYRNPAHETLHRFQMWGRPGPVISPGRSPALMAITLRGCVLAPGQIRRLWRQSVNRIGAQAPYSTTQLTPTPERPGVQSAYGGVDVTRALRYMTRSTYAGQGIDSTRFAGLHTRVTPRVRSKPVTLPAGGVKNRPTVRNRLTSFGSRVPTLNRPSDSTQGGSQQ